MAARRVSNKNDPSSLGKPGTTPEARENQLVARAVDLAEKQILAGTASAQVVTHYLKLGSSREKLEQLRMQHEIDLLEVKKEAIASAARVEELYKEALASMRAYAGQEPISSDDEEGDANYH